jgi:methane monooxygenase PmoA-like
MSALPRCRIVPLPDHQASFVIDDRERCRWHFGPSYPRPFFFPFVGPSGATLTRMGHPGAPDHDHHRSIWFAHEKVLGINFWGDQTPARVRQLMWLAYEDDDAECRMAVRLGWFDGHDPRELLEQELVAAVRPGPNDETLLELQSTFRPVAESLELGKTNFGFLAVRVAKSISEHFGRGRLTNSEAAAGEPAIFGQPARWMDYSGTVSADKVEGITYFDHPSNPGFPNCWHVRSDGWMGNSPCLRAPIVIQKSQPLVLRYLLHAHEGEASEDRAKATAEQFTLSRPFDVVKSTARHVAFQIRRVA